MKQCAVVLNGSDIIKVSNLKRKYNKIINNPNMKILEECDLDNLEEKYNYWNRTINGDPKAYEEEWVLKYRFENPKTGHYIVSIYPNLDNVKHVIKDWQDYVYCGEKEY